MKYQAVANGIGWEGHPVQSFSNDEKSIREWARLIANKYKCSVSLWAVELKSLGNVEPDKAKENASTRA